MDYNHKGHSIPLSFHVVITMCYVTSLFLGFDWSLHFKWDSLTAKEKQERRSHPVAPIRYMVVMHVYKITRPLHALSLVDRCLENSLKKARALIG